ncbi:MAG: type 1 glutamine amidotransferase [Chloroflexi bacterium]|nr:type 1 glutamine amidotransferase [Chloroflexota bacterium]
MRLHCLQHAAFEGPANIATWARARGHVVSASSFFAGEGLPDIGAFDWLVVMGGPMSVYEEKEYPWLLAEKKLVHEAIAAGKAVLGVCLGAQIVAEVLGAAVYKNVYKEIGWHPVSLTPEARGSSVFRGLPERFTAFHWHGDTFDLPAGCIRLAESEACRNQAFQHGKGVVGLQFHLESSPESVKLLVQNCRDEIVPGRYIQSAEDMLSTASRLQDLGNILGTFLDNIERSIY